MRFPEFLKENGTIGFVAPSFGCTFEPYKSAFANALKKFNELGYKTIVGPNCYEDCGVGISNTPEKCGEELNEMYCDGESDILISCGGGELMCEVVNFIDFDRIKESEPKWFMGYSDNTNFTFLSTILADTAAVYGPCAGTFGMEPWHVALNDTMNVLTGKNLTVSNYDMWEKESLKSEENPTAPYNVTEKTELKCFGVNDDQTKFSGRLVGGCIDCLVTLLGTKFDRVSDFNEKYKNDGVVWFLESCDLNVLAIRRAMWQMENAGWFDNATGFIIGRPLCMGQDMMGMNQYKAVAEIAGRRNVPIIMDADFGHLAPSMPLVSGSFANVTYSNGKLSITMNCK